MPALLSSPVSLRAKSSFRQNLVHCSGDQRATTTPVISKSTTLSAAASPAARVAFRASVRGLMVSAALRMTALSCADVQDASGRARASAACAFQGD